jgi:hypothetical protein
VDGGRAGGEEGRVGVILGLSHLRKVSSVIVGV